MASDSAWLLAASRKLRPARDATGGKLPTLWLFTDDTRTPDVDVALATLPTRVGVVLRGRARAAAPGRHTVAVAGDVGRALALGAGLHLPSVLLARPPFGWRRCRFVTAAIHTVPDAVRARRLGVAIGFVSPVFATRSHPGARVLGRLGARRVARHLPQAGFVGGLAKHSTRGLKGVAWGAIDALLSA
jgi:thiamine-phosphate pyrophosphorylase